MKRITFAASILLVVTLLALGATAFADEGDNILEIQVSPHTLNLASNGGSFSIHADVAYSTVDVVNLHVGDADLDCSTFADDLGNLVVKCDLEIVKDLVTEGEATFTLTVTLNDQDKTVLTGEETIAVVSHGQDGAGNGGGHGDCACDGNGDGDGDGSGDEPSAPGGDGSYGPGGPK